MMTEQMMDTMMALLQGSRIGYFDSLYECGPATAIELAHRTNRPLRETETWLEKQAAAGILQLEDQKTPQWERRYRLPASRAALLIELNDPWWAERQEAIAA